MSTNWQEVEKQFYLHTFNRVPVTIVRGKGARVWDDNDKEYLDFVGGWAVTNLGHCHPEVTEAIKRQSEILLQTSNQFYTIPQLKLAELLVKNSCLQRVFFANSGAEANEGAVKLARRYGKLNLNGAYEIISANNSFHGRTLAMTAATGQAKFQEPYLPLPAGFAHVEYGNTQALNKAITRNTCAVILELVQGESGVHTPDDSYFEAVREVCDRNGILLILDEIQTGLGRLGSLWGYQQFKIEPDVMTLAKGLANGIPIGAILAKEKASVFSPGEHGSTFGGNPFSCAVAYTTVKYIIDNDIPGKARETGDYFIKGLKEIQDKYSFVSCIRGRGLLLAIEFDKEIGQEVLLKCLEKGLLVNNVRPNTIRFMPPLIITKEDVDEALKILNRVLSEVNR